MSADVREYSPRNIAITWGAVAIDSGFADGSFITVEPTEDETTEQVGADGSVTLVENMSRLVTITVTLQQTSPKNAELMAVIEAARLAKVRAILPFSLTDLGGTTVVFAEKAWLKKRPTAEFAKEGVNRVWTFCGLWDEMFIGGN